MRKKQCVAMLLAGGQGSRLGILTKDVAKPAVPYGGKYRIIDFPLSNCTNSGIDVVGVLTQYRPLELNAYIGSGSPWDLDLSNGGVYVLPPYQTGKTGEWYKGTANAIYQNIPFIAQWDPEYVLVLSGDHIYKMDYNAMLREHIKNGADLTIAVREVPWEEAPRFGILNTDENNRITEFEEKPAQPKSNKASMGVYIFSWSKMRKYLGWTRPTRTATTTSARTSSRRCSRPGKTSTPTRLTATGRTSARSNPSGKRTWICSKCQCRSTCTTNAGAFTPVTRACRRTTSPTARRSSTA